MLMLGSLLGNVRLMTLLDPFFACLTEMGVMPEIAQAVEEMDWL